jgi:CMP-N-acetylneuraminic acid synthetase/regulator of RNase E activity RraA
MKKPLKAAVFLPAKGTSERIPSKNMKLLNGKPLFLHTLEKLCECAFIDEVYLDSESDEILNYAPHLPYKPLKRPPELAGNQSTGDMLLYHEAQAVDADIYIQVMCTLPFIKRETIEKGVSILREGDEYDSVVLVKREKRYEWTGNKPAYYVNGLIPNSFDLPDSIAETFGLYMTRKDIVLNQKCHIGQNPCLLFADPIEAIDINTPADFEVAEFICKGIQNDESLYFDAIKHPLSSCVFSDLLTAMGINAVIGGMELNLKDKKIMGRANTLKIRPVREGETGRGIYEALHTYETIRRGEIIVVENAFKDRAYFGEVNANLALRAGASATIIGGKTRDIEAVSRLDYPVFSMGYSCLDIRGMATFDSHHKPVLINNVVIHPGDLIFGDINGIVVIPRHLEKEIIKKAMDTVSKERDILDKIMYRQSAFDIYQSDGEF